ncbi:hypothetical protein BDA96_05G154300 [Sorghum bicolor]|uniref:Uncharacterized protein n=2 Tax=Sorghum bicolor TaxID=4558 RepID=A0A921R0K4_SORBI|nr:hypothetical protein BDA96_05G154300 [Sorghum bicolor]KXG28578.1 hypothetical protein SORBI_3005G140300 [Sorghum bicolor]
MASSIKTCTRIVYLAAALILVLGIMATFPSCQAGGCPGGIKAEYCFRCTPCINDLCIPYCGTHGYKVKGSHCVKRNIGEECCCKL